jgi:hypothetical protein
MQTIEKYRLVVALVAAVLLVVASFTGKHADANVPGPVAAAGVPSAR